MPPRPPLLFACCLATPAWATDGVAAPAPAAPPTDAAPVEATTPPERPARARRREEATPRSIPEADFLKTDLEVKARLGFNGYAPGPFSLFTSLGGWNEFGLSLDKGLLNWKDFTIGLGGTLWYGQAGILGAAIQRISNYEDVVFRWEMWEAGATARVTFHYTALQSVDPYLVGGLGGGAFQVRTRVRGWPDIDAVRSTSGYVRIEAGAGIMGRIKGGRWVVGGELRYLVAIQLGATDQLLVEDATRSATFQLFPQHKPSRGFSWVVQAGYRF